MKGFSRCNFLASRFSLAMIGRIRAILILFSLAVLSGCASTKVTQQTPMASPGLARPIKSGSTTSSPTLPRFPADSSISADLSAPSTPPTADELETGRKLGALIAKDLVADIQAMGLSAVQAGPGAAPQVGDGVIRGYLVSVQGGSAVQAFRDWIGRGEFGAVYRSGRLRDDAPGLAQIGSGTLSSSGSKTPGVIAPAAVAIATGNPLGLIVVGATKLSGEASGRSTLEGRAKATADAIAEQLKSDSGTGAG